MADHGHGQQCTIMYELGDVFFWHTMSVLIGKKSFICGRTVELNGQSKMFTRMLAMGRHWRWTYKYIFSRQYKLKQRVA